MKLAGYQTAYLSNMKWSLIHKTTLPFIQTSFIARHALALYFPAPLSTQNLKHLSKLRAQWKAIFIEYYFSKSKTKQPGGNNDQNGVLMLHSFIFFSFCR